MKKVFYTPEGPIEVDSDMSDNELAALGIKNREYAFGEEYDPVEEIKSLKKRLDKLEMEREPR